MGAIHSSDRTGQRPTLQDEKPQQESGGPEFCGLKQVICTETSPTNVIQLYPRIQTC